MPSYESYVYILGHVSGRKGTIKLMYEWITAHETNVWKRKLA